MKLKGLFYDKTKINYERSMYWLYCQPDLGQYTVNLIWAKLIDYELACSVVLFQVATHIGSPFYLIMDMFGWFFIVCGVCH